MAERIERIGKSVIVYDHALADQIDVSVFDMTSRIDSIGHGEVAGRGRVAFIDVNGYECVLRHYYRGGMIGRIVNDTFAWAGESQTRSFAEWRLLATLRQLGLPVPQPVAARYVRRGLSYTADLVTIRLSGVRSLAARLIDGPQPEDVWFGVGRLIRRFHDERVFHADLNAHNIQLGVEGDGYLLDFDRGRIMSAAGSWSTQNLQRLKRSLSKLARTQGAHFDESDWRSLTAGYGA